MWVPAGLKLRCRVMCSKVLMYWWQDFFFVPLWNCCSTAWRGSWGQPDPRSCGGDTESGHSVPTPRDNPGGKNDSWALWGIFSSKLETWAPHVLCVSLSSCLLFSSHSYQFERLASLWSCHSWGGSSHAAFCHHLTFILWVGAARSPRLVKRHIHTGRDRSVSLSVLTWRRSVEIWNMNWLNLPWP